MTLVLSGTISNYQGSESSLIVTVVPDWSSQPIGNQVVPISSSEVNYSIPFTTEVGFVVVLAADYDLGQAHSAGNYLGTYGWAGTTSIETAGNQGQTVTYLVANSVSIEVTAETTADFTMHQIVSAEVEGDAVVSATITWPDGGWNESSVDIYLYKTSVLTSAAYVQNPLYVNNTQNEDEVDRGDVVTFEVTGVGDNTYYCVIYDNEDQYIGTYGWGGSKTIEYDDITSDAGRLWSNIVSFEVSGSNVDLGTIVMHEIEGAPE